MKTERELFDKEFDDWLKSEMPNTYKGVGKEKLESFVYDTAMAAWQARVPDGYAVVPKKATSKMLTNAIKFDARLSLTKYSALYIMLINTKD